MPVLAIVVLVGLLVSLVMSLIRQNNSDILSLQINGLPEQEKSVNLTAWDLKRLR